MCINDSSTKVLISFNDCRLITQLLIYYSGNKESKYSGILESNISYKIQYVFDCQWHVTVFVILSVFTPHLIVVSSVQIGNLKAHLKIHITDGPLKCRECGKQFTTSGTRTVWDDMFVEEVFSNVCLSAASCKITEEEPFKCWADTLNMATYIYTAIHRLWLRFSFTGFHQFLHGLK